MKPPTTPGRAAAPHNMAYWKGEDYVGIGPGAVSTINGIRYSNTRDTDAYIRSTLENGLPSPNRNPSPRKTTAWNALP